MGNNISSNGVLQISNDSLSKVDRDSSGYHALLNSFLLRVTPLPQLDALDFTNFPSMVGYYKLIVEKAIHCIPLLPKWSLALGMFIGTLIWAYYDCTFHTLVLKHVHYLRSLDRETYLEAVKGALNFACNDLDVAATKVRKLEVLNQQMTKARAQEGLCGCEGYQGHSSY